MKRVGRIVICVICVWACLCVCTLYADQGIRALIFQLDPGEPLRPVPFPSPRAAGFRVMKARAFQVNLTPVNDILASAGIGQGVHLILYNTQEEIIADLGTFQLPLPAMHRQYITKNWIDRLKNFRLENNLPLNSPELGILVYKEIDGPIQGKVPVGCHFQLDQENFELWRLNEMIGARNFTGAEEFCGQQTGADQQESYQILARVLRQDGQIVKALSCFERAGHSGDRALTYGLLADQLKQQGKLQLARANYIKAIGEYEYLLKHFNYPWKEAYNRHRLRCIKERDGLPLSPSEEASRAQLQKILENTAQYCTALNGSALYYVCLEHIEETIDYSLIGDRLKWSALDRRRRTGLKTHTYRYDYQLIQDEDGVKETRILLRLDNRACRLKNAGLLSIAYRFQKPVFGPSGLFSTYWQSRHDYKIVAEEVYKGVPVVIVESIPLEPAAENALFGRAWIGKDDFSILRIDWSPKSMGISDIVERISESTGKTPAITFTIDYDYEKNGIRFPSRCCVREAYVDKDGGKSVLFDTVVEYKKYKFFRVESYLHRLRPLRGT
jgi:tetratricopeptide (TPR) repeat protein